MPDKLTPPIRYDRQKDRSSKRKRGTVMSEGGGKIIRPQKGLGFNELKKSFFITGAFDIPFFALTIIILAIGLVMLFPHHIRIPILNQEIHIIILLDS